MFFDVPMMLAINFLYQAICHSQYFTKCSGWIANPPLFLLNLAFQHGKS
jgi:hypothetical protein